MIQDPFRSMIRSEGVLRYRDLPWRRTRDPYIIWLSEVMLQQTQVPRVEARMPVWLDRFPTVQALAQAAEVGVRAGGIVTDTGGPGLPQGQGQGRGAEARGQRTPTARRTAAGQGTLGLLQQVVVDGVHPALHSVVIHSIPSFSSTIRRR